jgi:hypothetical protein
LSLHNGRAKYVIGKNYETKEAGGNTAVSSTNMTVNFSNSGNSFLSLQLETVNNLRNFSKLQQYSLTPEGYIWVNTFKLFHTFDIKLCTNTRF